MGEDIERRLTAAAEALREYEATRQRCADLDGRMGELAEHVAVLRSEHADEQADVDRLEGLSLTRLLTSLRGARDDALARERAEADAARYRAADAQARLDALRRDYEAAQVRLSELAGALGTYAEVLDEKERHLAESHDPRAARLLELAEERGRLNSGLREVSEARQAGRTARQALSRLKEKLGSASSWSTYDTFLGGGLIASAMKHSRLDEAARAAARADQCIAVLRSELADVTGPVASAPTLAVDGLTRFVDVWFDNVFTDFAVGSRIKEAQRNVTRSLQMVSEADSRLKDHGAQMTARLATIEADRHNLLVQP